jgi:hypothetical protein
MHDLNTIAKLNAEAFAEAVENFRRQGRFVIANYSGITLCSIETFTDEGDAMRAFADFRPEDPSNTVRLLFPRKPGEPAAS